MRFHTWWRRRGRAIFLGGVAAAMAWCAFVAETPVPLFDWFDLGVHETGHLLAAFAPDVVMFMAGSFAQVAVPVSLAGYFGLARRDLAAAGLCLAWAGTSAWDVSVYAADAVGQQLPLVGGGQHDWAFILGHFDALHLTAAIARGIETGGAALALTGLALIAMEVVPERTMPRRVLIPERVTTAPRDDAWVAAGRLPFRHDRTAG